MSNDAHSRRRAAWSPSTSRHETLGPLGKPRRRSSPAIAFTAVSSRSRFIAVVCFALVGLAWLTLRSRSVFDDANGLSRQRDYARLSDDNDVDIWPERKHSPHELIGSTKRKQQPVHSEPIEVDPRPIARLPTRDLNVKYLAYHPHSGFHNQRIALENALVLAKMLDRTLLIPPVWLGHAVPWIAFDKLYGRIRQARKYGLEHCKDYAKAKLMPWECLSGYWDYTLVSWDTLIDLRAVAETQPLVDGWDASYEWLEKELGINMKTDIAFVKDDSSYDYRIYDVPSPTAPLGKFTRRLDIDSLNAEYGKYRLLHFGSLYGTSRLWLTKPENRAMHTLARRSMVFKHELLDRIADIVAARLGGQNAYFGLHVGLGDGIFQEKAEANALAIFDRLVVNRLGLSPDLAGDLKRLSAQAHGGGSRDPSLPKREYPATNQNASSDSESTVLSEHTVSRGRDPHLHLPPLRTFRNRRDLPLHTSLSCRGSLHKDEHLLPLNTPIYLATDSRYPSKDAALQIFFDTFPCIFTLADFVGAKPTMTNAELPMDEVEMLKRLQNKEDGVKLAKFLYPMLDAMIAAKGRDMIGTIGSTFSQFGTDVLHRVYHDWPIVERGKGGGHARVRQP